MFSVAFACCGRPLKVGNIHLVEPHTNAGAKYVSRQLMDLYFNNPSRTGRKSLKRPDESTEVRIGRVSPSGLCACDRWITNSIG